MLKPKYKNHCQLAHPNPKLEQKEKYAHGIRYRLKNKLATQTEIKAELSKRKDEKLVLELLKEMKNGTRNKSF